MLYVRFSLVDWLDGRSFRYAGYKRSSIIYMHLKLVIDYL
jgi:hypothetical protein